jgi:Ribbon-helix-helix protein, copG family
MRTTLTLDDDVAAKLKAEARRAGRPFREVVNDALRRGLASRRVTGKRQDFKITARGLGNLKPGLSLDNVAELIERVEGSLHR